MTVGINTPRMHASDWLQLPSVLVAAPVVAATKTDAATSAERS